MQDPLSWNKFILAHASPSGAFLQSFEWGRFQEACGTKVFRVDETVGQNRFLAQILIRELPLGMRVAYIPRGPISTSPEGITFEAAAQKVIPEAARPAGAIALRIDPATALGGISGARKVRPLQPQTTIILDLTKSDEELLASMHEKTRYNIRLAAKKGVHVREGGAELFPTLWSLMEQTSERDRFHTHTRRYYETMLNTLGSDPKDAERASSRILLAEHEGKPLAGMILLRFGDVATYLHGGSSNDGRNLMAPHLLHFETIRYARASGAARYDLWGVAPSGATKHSLLGVSRFKRGFGGIEWTAPDSLELPIRRGWYTIYRLARLARGR